MEEEYLFWENLKNLNSLNIKETILLHKEYKKYIETLEDYNVNPHYVIQQGSVFFHNFIKKPFTVMKNNYTDIVLDKIIKHVFWNIIVRDWEVDLFILEEHDIHLFNIIELYKSLKDNLIEKIHDNVENDLTKIQLNGLANYIIFLGEKQYNLILQYPRKLITDKNKFIDEKGNLKVKKDIDI